VAKTPEEFRIYHRERQRRYRAKNRERFNAHAREYQRKKRATPEGRVANTRACRKRQTGWTPEMWDAAIVAQDGLCAICRFEAHNHGTKQTRSILCRFCNTGLGLFRESPERLASAIVYINKWNNG